MKKILILLHSFLTLLFVFNVSVSAAEFSLAEVAKHNTESDCWMVFEGNVYNITSYVDTHDQFLDIREWCGNDMTEDFKTKAGEGKDHKPATYEMLKDYLIGDLGSVSTTVERSNPYNFIIPFASALTLYLLSYFAATRGWFNKLLILPKINLFWNSMLVVFLIPSVIFGFILVFQYPFPALAAIKFDFLYWHVEGSIAFGTLVVCHFIQRFKQYLVPFRLFKKTVPTNNPINNE